MQPRVLIVAPRLDIGGTEMHLTRVLPALRRQGVDVSVFTLTRGGALEEKLIAGEVPVSGPAAGGRGLVRRLGAAVPLRRELRARPPHIIHSFLPEPYLIGSLASAGIRGVARIMSRRSLAVYQQNHPVMARVEHSLHRHTDVLLGNSSAVVEQLVVECGDRSKVELIHNGIDVPPLPSPDMRQALRQEFGIPQDAFVIAVNANLIAYKGHADLFEALGQIRHRLGRTWRLLLIGRDLGAGAALRRQAEVLEIAGNILWIDDRMDPSVALAGDIAVLPSHQEGFSNSLIEAMGYALPVIATRVGGNIDAVVAGESGLLVPVRDPAALANAISALRDDAGLRQRLGDAARARVNALFSLENCVARYLELYRRLLPVHIGNNANIGP